jgi:hypothetical protein
MSGQPDPWIDLLYGNSRCVALLSSGRLIIVLKHENSISTRSDALMDPMIQ